MITETMNINKATTSKSFEFRMKGYDPFVVQSIPELCDYISVFEPFAYFIIPNWARTSEVGSKFIDPKERYEVEIIQSKHDNKTISKDIKAVGYILQSTVFFFFIYSFHYLAFRYGGGPAATYFKYLIILYNPL